MPKGPDGGLGTRGDRARDGRAIAVVLAAVIGMATGAGACAHAPARFDPSARRTCLVLSAGGLKGPAELGAVAAVRESGLHVSCVVGTSVGALVGGLYASAPLQDTTERFRRVTRAYADETRREAEARGLGAGVMLAAIAGAISGGWLAPAGAALGGFVLGAGTTSRADRGRLERVLSVELAGARVEALPIPFATFHHERSDHGLALVVDRSGDLAAAVGASIANPFVFDDVDIANAPAIDPGSDRLAATPVEDACRLFPDSNLLVVNISGNDVFRSADTAAHCPMREVAISLPPVSPEEMIEGGATFDAAVRIGHDGVLAALRRTD